MNLSDLWPKRVLMVRPNGFRVEYAINPYMLDSQGNLQTVDSRNAMAQWQDLKLTYERLGLSVEVVEGDPEFPDMVFCANQTLPYRDRNGRLKIVLSRMHSLQRRGEVKHFRAWAEHLNIPCYEMTDYAFEGAGDALWNYETGELFGGYGFRSERKAYDLVEKLVEAPVHRLQLVSEHFYHMDTCLAILDGQTAAWVPEAFSSDSQSLLRRKFSRLIEVDLVEAKTCFATNCVSVGGSRVLLQNGAKRFIKNLTTHGFTPIELETSEFIKSGGSVFCMKQFLP